MSAKPRAHSAGLVRVLHVVGGMPYGGTETWLVSLLRCDRSAFIAHFLVDRREPQAYEAELNALGARVVRGGRLRNPIAYSTRLMRILKTEGPYDVVHSHIGHFSGLVMAIARIAGVPVRIAHGHSAGGSRRSVLLAVHVSVGRFLINMFATHGLAVSEAAGRFLFGRRWRKDGRYRAMACGIDLARYGDAAASTRGQIRRELEVPTGAVVVGHVGRFVPEKNHDFLLDLAEALKRRGACYKLVLVGDGPRRNEIAAQVTARDLGNVILTGARADVPSLMAAMDVFVFPSLTEGLGLAVVEAQAAGLPCLMFDDLPRESVLERELVHRLARGTDVELWADTVEAAARGPRRFPDTSGWPFSVQDNLSELALIYQPR